MAARKKMRRFFLNALIGCCIFAFCVSQAQAQPNAGMCPVMPGREAKSHLSVDYQGKIYYLCCTSCVKLFKRNPLKYIKNF